MAWLYFYSFIFLSSEKNEPGRAVLVIHVLFLLTPPSFGHLPYILRCKTQGRRVRVTLRSLQCDTPHTGHGKGGLWYKGLSFPAKDSLGCIRFTLFVHSSQQREERTKKRRRCYRAFGFVAMVAVGVCGTRFARTVLALFPPSSLWLHRPIKAESGVLPCILTLLYYFRFGYF